MSITITTDTQSITVDVGEGAAASAAAIAARNQAVAAAASADADAMATAADRVATGEDRTASEAARDAAAASAAAADDDATATAADRVQTGLDRVATGADVVAAAASETAAAASAVQAATYDPTFRYATVQLLLDSTRAAGGAGTIWQGEGFLYREADAAATDEHVTTAGGVKLYALPGDDGYNVKAFGAAGDGVTDETAAIQTAIDACAANLGGDVRLPAGSYVNTGLTLTDGVNLRGDGMVHRFFYRAAPASVYGTVLLTTVGAGGVCLAFEDTQQGFNGVSDLSIFEAGSAAFNSIVRVNGSLHPFLTNVELGCLNTVNRGIGLLLGRGSHGNGSIYGVYTNVVTTRCHTGLKMEDDANSNSFHGGSFQGDTYSALITVNATSSGPQSNAFTATSFESTYNSAIQDIEFIAGATNIHGFSNVAAAYVVKTIKITHADGLDFAGCYFENGGATGTFNDGVNGSASVVPCIAVDAASPANARDINWTGRIAGYVYDKGQNVRFSLLPSGRPYATPRPVSLIRRNTTATVVPSATFTPLTFVNTPSWASNVEQEIGYNNATGVITFKQPGLYRCYCQIFYPPTVGAFQYLRAVTGTGTVLHHGLAGGDANRGLNIDFIYDADVGETIVFQMFQNSGASVTVSADANFSYLHVVKISA